MTTKDWKSYMPILNICKHFSFFLFLPICGCTSMISIFSIIRAEKCSWKSRDGSYITLQFHWRNWWNAKPWQISNFHSSNSSFRVLSTRLEWPSKKQFIHIFITSPGSEVSRKNPNLKMDRISYCRFKLLPMTLRIMTGMWIKRNLLSVNVFMANSLRDSHIWGVNGRCDEWFRLFRIFFRLERSWRGVLNCICSTRSFIIPSMGIPFAGIFSSRTNVE